MLLLLLLQSMAVCSAKQQAIYLSKLNANVESLNYYHNGLFLGAHTFWQAARHHGSLELSNKSL
jgi:hypothetical protein